MDLGTTEDIDLRYDKPQWYAVYTCANREKLVAAQFASRGIEHFLPLFESVREWSDRRVRLQMPLFPGYLFVFTSLRNRLPILTAPGVVHLVNVAGQPVPLATEVIDTLRKGLSCLEAEPFPYLTTGQRVSICAGPFKGLAGILLRRRSGPRVVVSIEAIQRSLLVHVAASDLVPIGQINALGSIQANVPDQREQRSNARSGVC